MGSTPPQPIFGGRHRSAPLRAHPRRVAGHSRGTDFPALPSSRGPSRGPFSRGWKWPGLSFGRLPTSHLAEGWGRRGPRPLSHTPPMTGSSLHRKPASLGAAWGSCLLDVRRPAGECAHRWCEASGHLVRRQNRLERSVLKTSEDRCALAPRPSAGGPPQRQNPLPRTEGPCCSARGGWKRRGQS